MRWTRFATNPGTVNGDINLAILVRRLLDGRRDGAFTHDVRL